MNKRLSPTLNSSYSGSRPDIRRLVPDNIRRVLDVGCNAGALGQALKAEHPSLTVYGIELDARVVPSAVQRLDKVFHSDVETFAWTQLHGLTFDCIIFADILEHLHHPWIILENAADYLSPGGSIIISLPNIRHISSFYWIYVRGIWPMRDRGIHDKTHLRFFTLHNIHQLLATTGYAVIKVRRQYRLLERPSRLNELLFTRLRGAAFMDRLPVIREFLTYQYLIVAKRLRSFDNGS